MKLTSLAISAALALSAGAALAQPPAPPPPGSAPGAEHRHWQRPDPAQMAERHAQRLRDALQLRPDQEPALQALVAAAKPPSGPREHMRREEGRGPLTTPERLDREQARMAERAQRFEARAAALKRFYAQLGPTQQKAFDALHQGHGMGRGHGMHGGKGFGGHGFGEGFGHRGPGFARPGAAPPPAGE